MYSKTVTVLEKIHYVVQLIAHKLELAPAGSAITITEIEVSNIYTRNPLSSGDFANIVEKLVRDEQVIVVRQYPAPAKYNKYTGQKFIEAVRHYQLSTTSKFEAYRQKIQTQFDEESTAGALNLLKPFSSAPGRFEAGIAPATSMYNALGLQENPATQQEACVSIRFDEVNRHILLNDSFLIAQPSYDSENYRFFEYVWHNPNRTISLQELNEKLEEPLKKSIAKVLQNLNFQGELREAFFQASKLSVCFTPSRSIQDLIAANLYPLRLFSTRNED